MKIISIIPADRRDHKSCYFCGSTKSVKYVTETKIPARNIFTTVCACNKCALREDSCR